MSDIKFMEKPDWVSWESIKECLVSGHSFNKKKGFVMKNPTKSPQKIENYLKDGYCFVAMDGDIVVGTCSLKVFESKYWWAKRKKVAYTCMDAIIPKYKGTDVFFGLNNFRNNYINDLGLRIIQFETHEKNKVVQKINLKYGAKYVRYVASSETDYYSVVMVFWLDGCPYSNWYCNFRFKLSRMLTRLLFKPGRKPRLKFW